MGFYEAAVSLCRAYPSFPLFVGFGASYIAYYIICVAKRPMLVGRDNKLKAFLLNHCSILKEKYKPTLWCFESRIQTILRPFIKTCPIIPYISEIISTPDGGQIKLDWHENRNEKYPDSNSRPTVLILPGLIGSSKESYIVHLVENAAKLGYRSVVFNNRGNGGAKLLLLKIKLRSNVRQHDPETESNHLPENYLTGAALRMRRYREKKKNDPEAYQLYLAEEALRKKSQRLKRTNEQRDRDRETGRARQRRYDMKKKAQLKQLSTQDTSSSCRPVQTRRTLETMREKWRNAKRRYRDNINPQKRPRIREKDANRKRLKKSPVSTVAHGSGGSANDFSSNVARRKALSRAKSAMPKNDQKFATTVSGLICRSTPGQRKAIDDLGTCHSDKPYAELFRNMKGKIQQLKQNDHARANKRLLISSCMVQRKYRMLTSMFGVRPGYITSLRKKSIDLDHDHRLRKERKDKTTAEITRKIQKFYTRPDVSRELPCMMRSVGKSGHGKHVMERSVESAYQIWRTENPAITVGKSIFFAQRPSWVLLQCHTKLNQCLCEYCTDVMLKIRPLNTELIRNKMDPLKICDKYDLVNMTLCKPEDPALKCVRRTCTECGVIALTNRFLPLTQAELPRLLTWKKWETISETCNGNEIYKKKKMLMNKSGTIRDLLGELTSEVDFLAFHLFVARWQQQMFSLITKEVPEHCVVMVLDFAENYRCSSQDEIQSAHWAVNQVTVHPIIAWYNCQQCENSHVTQEALIFISDDLTHDWHAVNHFTVLASKYLKEKRLPCGIQQQIQFTDGCGAQYKSKGPFADLSFAKHDLGFPIERHYFGSRHGKGPSDGVSAVIKSAVRRAVMSRQAVINNGQEMFNFCQSNLIKQDSCKAQRRAFFYVSPRSIVRAREDRQVKSTLPGTRTFHAVKTVTPGVVSCRQLSCFCNYCLKLHGDSCTKKDHVLPWITMPLKMSIEPPVIVQEIMSNPAENLLENDDGDEQPADPFDGSIQDIVQEIEDINSGDAELVAESISQQMTTKSPPVASVGDWVAVIYDDIWWPGTVDRVVDQSLRVSFMKPVGANKFIWRYNSNEMCLDAEDVPHNEILTILSEKPFPTSNRYFAFSKEYAISLEQLMKTV